MSHQSTHPPELREKRSSQAVLVGLLSNLVLAVLKTSIGVIGHSPALLADGVNSTSDVAYSLVVSVFVRLANKPADDQHPYGHSQLESIGAVIVGAFVITTAISIFWNSVNAVYDYFSGSVPAGEGSLLALAVAVGTVLIKILLTGYTRKVGDAIQNPSVIALAYDHRNDIFSALAAVAGISFHLFGQAWMDPLAGAAVSLVILKTGIDILRESTADLMDTIPGKALDGQVRALLAEVKEVEKIDEVTFHRFGPFLTINLTICVDGALSIEEGDRIATRVEDLLFDRIDLLRHVHVHYHPPKNHEES